MVMGGGGDDDDGDDAMDNLITHENTGTYVFNVSVGFHAQTIDTITNCSRSLEAPVLHIIRTIFHSGK